MAQIKPGLAGVVGQGCLAKSDWSGEFEAQVTESRTPIGWVRHLKVKRHDGREGISWDVLQIIKNELLGPDALAIEFYPPVHDVVDETNMRHLWEVPTDLLAFGLHAR
jgi:hypothetical protein